MTKIPQEIIAKAVEGGWKERFGDSHWSTNNNQVKVWNCEAIALDRNFWIALGKSLKWDVLMMYYRCPADECGSMTEWSAKRYCPECGTQLEECPTLTKNWLKHARNFFDLILNEQETNSFWQSLLNI